MPTPVRAWWEGLSPNLRGALCILLAALLLTIMGAMVKDLGQQVHPFQMAFIRCVVGTVAVAPFILKAGLGSMRTPRLGLHILRVLIGTSGMYMVFYAFSNMPLAEAIAIIFSRPIFSVLLAFVILHEAVGWRRAAAAGFAGVLIMLRPGSAVFDPVSLVAVAAAMAAGCTAIVIKKLSATESTATIIIWFTVGGMVIGAIPAAFVWQWLTPSQWAMMIGIGVVGILGQTALTRGFSMGETSFVTPFDYSRLLYATLIGLVVFGELPDLWTFVGALVIVGSGYYIARRELAANRAKRLAQAEAPGPAPAAESPGPARHLGRGSPGD